MGVNLTKGEAVVLSKVAPTLNNVVVGLGWNPATEGAAFDADASVFLLSGDARVRSDADFIYFNNKQSADGSVQHMGDNRTGEGDGDDEQIKINLSTVPGDVQSIPVTVTIYQATARNQSFANLSEAFVRLVNEETGEEVARYDLSGMGAEKSMVFGKLDRTADGWAFTAVGQPVAGEIGDLAASYGVNV